MKKTGIIVAVLLACAGLAFAGNRTEVTGNSSLPLKAQNFVNEYFPGLEAKAVEQDGPQMIVSFNDGTKISFTNSGEWIAVDGRSDSLSRLEGVQPKQAGHALIVRTSY